MCRLSIYWTLWLLLSGSTLRAQTVESTPSQDSARAPVSEKLELITIGSTAVSAGRRGGFRIYAAPDGTKADVYYARSTMDRDAGRQTQVWLKSAGKILHKTNRIDSSGHIVEARIIAQARDEGPGGKLFIIIRRNGLNCYFIESLSLPVAMQLEALIRE